jgi:hypothetical protein
MCARRIQKLIRCNFLCSFAIADPVQLFVEPLGDFERDERLAACQWDKSLSNDLGAKKDLQLVLKVDGEARKEVVAG